MAKVWQRGDFWACEACEGSVTGKRARNPLILKGCEACEACEGKIAIQLPGAGPPKVNAIFIIAFTTDITKTLGSTPSNLLKKKLHMLHMLHNKGFQPLFAFTLHSHAFTYPSALLGLILCIEGMQGGLNSVQRGPGLSAFLYVVFAFLRACRCYIQAMSIQIKVININVLFA